MPCLWGHRYSMATLWSWHTHYSCINSPVGRSHVRCILSLNIIFLVLNSFANIHSKQIPNLLLAWLGLQVVNIVLNVYTVVLMIIAAASGINPDLVDEMVEIGIEANDVPTLIWISAIGASGIYFTATGKGLIHFNRSEQNIRGIFSGHYLLLDHRV